MLKWLLRRFRFVQDLELDVQNSDRALKSADHFVSLLEALKADQEQRIKDLQAENEALRKENAELKGAL